MRSLPAPSAAQRARAEQLIPPAGELWRQFLATIEAHGDVTPDASAAEVTFRPRRGGPDEVRTFVVSADDLHELLVRDVALRESLGEGARRVNHLPGWFTDALVQCLAPSTSSPYNTNPYVILVGDELHPSPDGVTSALP